MRGVIFGPKYLFMAPEHFKKGERPTFVGLSHTNIAARNRKCTQCSGKENGRENYRGFFPKKMIAGEHRGENFSKVKT